IDATTLTSVAVFGPLADARNLGDGGSSDVYAPTVVTPMQGLVDALPGAAVTHHATPEATGADVAVVVVGYTRADEGEFIGDTGTSALRALLPGPDDPDEAAAFAALLEAEDLPALAPGSEPATEVGGFSTGGDRASLRLSDADEALIAAVATHHPRTVVVLIGGSAVVMEPWRTAVPAIAQLWYSGMEGGHALAEVLLGQVDATGRLPFTIPADEQHLPPFDRDADTATYDRWHGYWLLARDRHEAAFPFGFGLSYTTFEIGPTTVDDDGEELVVRAVLRNTGGRDGTDVVQVYAGRPADPDRPTRRLVAFARVDVAAGAEADVELRVPWTRLAVRDAAHGRWTVVPGTYAFTVGRHSADVLSVDLIIDRPGS
ncbi:MAG: glycoside hydrolase family 3 C-terminal domain-containing protein, partial [Acidimicrobiales bacterium]